jgi:hypothetical protein
MLGWPRGTGTLLLSRAAAMTQPEAPPGVLVSGPASATSPMRSRSCGCDELLEHLGSAHDDAELELLKAAARQRGDRDRSHERSRALDKERGR